MSFNINNQFNNMSPAVSQLVKVNVITVILLCMFVSATASANVNLASPSASTPILKFDNNFHFPASDVQTAIGGYVRIGHYALNRFLADASNSREQSRTKTKKTSHKHKTKATHRRIKHWHKHYQDTASMLMKNEVADKMPVATPMPPAKELKPEVMPEMTKMPDAPILTTDGIIPGEHYR